MTMRIFIFGAGYSGRAFAALRTDAARQRSAARRGGGKFDALRAAGIVPRSSTATLFTASSRRNWRGTTHLVDLDLARTRPATR